MGGLATNSLAKNAVLMGKIAVEGKGFEAGSGNAGLDAAGRKKLFDIKLRIEQLSKP